jgi:hypothetical protein
MREPPPPLRVKINAKKYFLENRAKKRIKSRVELNVRGRLKRPLEPNRGE